MKIKLFTTTYFIFVILFFLSSCKSIINKNELILSNKKLDFNFSTTNFIVNGEVRFLSGKNDVLININNNFLSGEIIPKHENKTIYVNYSFIYKNDFIRGGYIEQNNVKNVKFSILSESLDGTITKLDSNNAIFSFLITTNKNLTKKITGKYKYFKQQNKVMWQYTIDDDIFIINITTKNRKVYYDFKNSTFNENEMIIFLILEFMRLQR